jgi:hypothetical protein
LGEVTNRTAAHSDSDSNSYFIYNGHTWDAYEVLGIEPGCSIEKIKEAFEASLLRTEAGSHEFLKSALSAILAEMKGRGFRP